MQQIQHILRTLFSKERVRVDYNLRGSTTTLLASFAFLPVKELLNFNVDIKEDYQDIFTELDAADELEPVALLLLKGMLTMQSGREDALKYLYEAQKLQITALGYSYLALCYFIEEDFDKAIQVYTTAISDFPKEPYFYACRCVLNRQSDDDEGAFYDYQVAKRLDFNYHSLLEWHEHLLYLETLKVDQLELNELERTWVQDPQQLDILIKLALEYVHIYDYQKAISLYSQGIIIADNQAEWYVYRAAIYSKLTLYAEAMEDCIQALAIDANCVSAYVLRAKLQECLQEHDEALEDYKKAAFLNPEQSVIYEERASLFERLGKFEDAIVDYSKLISLMKDDFYPYVLRADMFERIGKQEEALWDYDRAIDLNPYYSDLYQYRAAIRESLGDKIGAEADLQKFEELDEE